MCYKKHVMMLRIWGFSRCWIMEFWDPNPSEDGIDGVFSLRKESRRRIWEDLWSVQSQQSPFYALICTDYENSLQEYVRVDNTDSGWHPSPTRAKRDIHLGFRAPSKPGSRPSLSYPCLGDLWVQHQPRCSLWDDTCCHRRRAHCIQEAW